MTNYEKMLDQIKKEYKVFNEDFCDRNHRDEIVDACIDIGKDRWFQIAEEYIAVSCPDSGLSYHFFENHPNGMMGHIIGITIDALCIVGQDIDIDDSICKSLGFTKYTIPPVLYMIESMSLLCRLKNVISHHINNGDSVVVFTT